MNIQSKNEMLRMLYKSILVDNYLEVTLNLIVRCLNLKFEH